MRWAITHKPQDLPRSKHTLAEGKPLEEDMPLPTDDFITAMQNPRVVKDDRCFVQLVEAMDISELSLSKREILKCL